MRSTSGSLSILRMETPKTLVAALSFEEIVLLTLVATPSIGDAYGQQSERKRKECLRLSAEGREKRGLNEIVIPEATLRPTAATPLTVECTVHYLNRQHTW